MASLGRSGRRLKSIFLSLDGKGSVADLENTIDL